MRYSRRRFCRSAAVTVSAAAAFPGTIALGRPARPARFIPGDVPAVRLDGTPTSIAVAEARELADSLGGEVLLRGEFGYDGARQVWNGMHDRYPALIVRAGSDSDVASAIDFARERELLLAVKGGGHSWPGKSVADGALMIDLSAINGVIVDPASRRAKVGGGALLYDLDIASLRHHLATTAGIVSHTGVGGLTLGGGYGRLGRRFGLTIDNLVSARLVTAAGQVLSTSNEEHPDLFWAIRGGDGNFGVVTEFEFELHDVSPEMYGGTIRWPMASARDVLEFYAEHCRGFSNELFAAPGVATGPDGTAMLNMDICHCGSRRAAERELAALRSVARPAVDAATPTSYLSMQTSLDGVARPGIRSYIKSGMVGEFTPALIDAMLGGYEPGSGVILNSFATGGRIAEVPEEATAWPHRKAVAMIATVAFWPHAELDEARVAATRSLWAGLEPLMGGYYANIQAEDIEVPENYGPVYKRLVSIKNRYDPTNLFRLNSNIRPTA